MPLPTKKQAHEFGRQQVERSLRYLRDALEYWGEETDEGQKLKYHLLELEKLAVKPKEQS
jgi:hypothetical protein